MIRKCNLGPICNTNPSSVETIFGRRIEKETIRENIYVLSDTARFISFPIFHRYCKWIKYED